jgi:hypothetical protein
MKDNMFHSPQKNKKRDDMFHAWVTWNGVVRDKWARLTVYGLAPIPANNVNDIHDHKARIYKLRPT